MFASGVVANCPSSDKASPIFCSSVKYSGKLAKILPESEMSFGTMLTSATEVKALTIGKKECVASIGASSVSV